MINLVQESKASIRWIRQILKAFLQVRPGSTAGLIISLALKNFFALLAGFLPLKVILLAGSDGIPRYFQFFIPADADKIPWIIGFSLAAVICFFLALLMENLSRKLSSAGSFDVLQGANEMAVASKQREEAGAYFFQFSEIAANGIILFAALTLLATINLPVFMTLCGLMLVQYLFTAGALGFGDPLKPAKIERTIRLKLRSYLGFLSSINFLICFFVLLTPFLTGVGGNLLLAILSLLLIGQARGATNGIVRNTGKLWGKRAEIDPLVFREEQVQRVEKPIIRELRLAFGHAIRAESAHQQLASAGLEVSSIQSNWQDPKIRDIYWFHLQCSAGGRRKLHFQQQVFPQRQLHLLEHEEFLFTKLSRDAVQAPQVMARFTDEPFNCQICEYGSGKAATRKQWPELGRVLFANLWKFQPPQPLVSAYQTAHSGLEARLSLEYIQRVEVALDNKKHQQIYGDFIMALPLIQRLVQQIPLHLHNPDLSTSNVVLRQDEQPLIMTWVRWKLVPLGSFLPPKIKSDQIEDMLNSTREVRGFDSEQVSNNHIWLSNNCQKLEDALNREFYHEALTCMKNILSNELIANAANS